MRTVREGPRGEPEAARRARAAPDGDRSRRATSGRRSIATVPDRDPGSPLLAAAVLAVALVGGRILVPPTAPLPAEAQWRTELATANAAFREALDASPDLDPEVRAVIEKNLAVIDGAIAEIEAALERNPSSPMLQKALVAMEQQRLDVLRQLTLSSKAG